MDGQVWLRVLGPVDVRSADGWLSPSGRQPRLLLAFLAISAGQVVPTSDLVDVIWEQRPPPSARASLQILVTRLRRTVGLERGLALDRYGDGYQLRLSPDLVDVHRFRSLVRSARHARDHQDAMTALGQALALWRGPALADVPGTARVEAIRAGLAQEQLSAVQDRLGCLLATGQYGEAAAEIPLMLARHPLAEQLAGMLMIAWYRCGRQADALQVFRDLRGRLVQELGVEPGPELQRLQQRILAGDPAVEAPRYLAAPLRPGTETAGPAGTLGRPGAIPRMRPAPSGASGRPGSSNGARRAGTRGHTEQGSEEPGQPGLHPRMPAGDAVALQLPSENGNSQLPGGQATTAALTPRQLPAAPAHFTGRRHELKLLSERLDTPAAAGVPAILAISGTAGVGKTALALHWAHHAQQQFPDGQLYVNLRGFDASPAPVTPAEALTGLLASLGMTAGQGCPDAQAALYRSMLAGRRMLIVLDNARDEAQVRPLLPGSATCVVLVTSRSEFAGLVATEGARPLMLDVLTASEAREFLDRRLGPERLVTETEAVTELTELCARLPLALAITAARAAVHTTFPLASVAAGLRDARYRLDGLDAGEQAASMRAVFSWSYRLLDEPAARMFRLLGAHPGPDISAAAAASLAAVPAPSAHAALRALVRANLIQEQRPGRFGLHDLLRAYAAELCDESERRSAIQRVVSHYLHTARAAVSLAYPPARQVTAAPSGPAQSPELLSDPGSARAWLQAEHQVLLAAVGAAADCRLDTAAWQLPAVLREYFARRGHYADWAQTQQTALAAADRLGDDAARALAHRNLGDALIQLGSREAHSHLQTALGLYRRLKDHAGQAACHCSTARLCEFRDDNGQALYHAQQALRLYRAAGDTAGQAAALNGVGWFSAQLGNNERALSYCGKALELHRATGNRFGEAATLDSLGYCCHQAGRHSEAAAFYQQALGAYADTGDRYFRAHTLIRLGDTHLAAGQQEATRQLWHKALTILEDLHHLDAGHIRTRLRNMVIPASRH